MYAVFESGGKQHRVQPGDIVQVEKLEGEVGKALSFDKVLLLTKGEGADLQLGKPYVSGATVAAEIVGQGRGEKILIVKMKRRKQYRRTQGHRQEYTQLLVVGVGSTTLSDADKKAKLASFQSHLKPRGLAHTPKTYGSRKRMAQAKAAGGAAAATTEKKAPAKKAAAKKAK